MTKLNTDNRLDQYTVFNRHQAIEHWISENEKTDYFGKADQSIRFQNLRERLQSDIITEVLLLK